MMECYCDYEMPNVYRESRPIARKAHQCDECRRAIDPGTRYLRIFGVWDGRADTFKRCLACLRLTDYIKAHIPCFCDQLGGLADIAFEELREAPEIGFGGTRRYVEAFRWRELADWKSKRTGLESGVRA